MSIYNPLSCRYCLLIVLALYKVMGFLDCLLGACTNIIFNATSK